MKGEGSRIYRSGNKTRGNRDRGKKDEGSVRLADTTVCQGYPKVFGIGKLLLPIY